MTVDLLLSLSIGALGPSVAFIAWWFQYSSNRQRQHDNELAKNNLVRALYAEIDFNTSDMEIFLKESANGVELWQAIKENIHLIPFVTDARHRAFYDNLVGDLWVISDRLMAKIVLFYGLLEKISVQVEGLNNPSYLTLSDEGRFRAVDVIKQTSLDALLTGRDLLFELEHEYTDLSLHRYIRPANESDSDLKLRSQEFERKLFFISNK